MKVGILTVPFNNNYGGYLQSYALMEVLRCMGHEPTLIMRRHASASVSIAFHVKFFVKRIIKSIICGKVQPCVYNCELSFKSRGREMLEFVEKYMQPQTNYIYTDEDLKKECDGRFDAYIVGSDQVWRSIYVPTIIGNMYLDFTKGWNVKRIAYAASFGIDNPEYTDEEKNYCGKLIETFDIVSVREKSALKVIEGFNWNVTNPQVVLDPTLLLTKEDYNRLLPKASQRNSNIFCYVLDDTEAAIKVISEFQQQLNMPICKISNIQGGDTVLPSIESWLVQIRDSDFVITDSFHGTVFSIIYNKPFAVYVNKVRGSTRFMALLEQFDLEKRIIQDKYSISRIINEQIDWMSVNKKVAVLAEFSKQFLENNLL